MRPMVAGAIHRLPGRWLRRRRRRRPRRIGPRSRRS